jgi:hypothetical protein
MSPDFRKEPAMKYLTIVPALLLALPVAADPVTDILATAATDCAGFENGVLDATDAAVPTDLDGLDPLDTLLDMSRVTCSSAASLYCGSGGCSLHAVIGDESWEFQAEGWRMIEWDGRPILLIARDGGWCGGIGAQICFEAVSWSDGRMMTVMPPFE